MRSMEEIKNDIPEKIITFSGGSCMAEFIFQGTSMQGLTRISPFWGTDDRGYFSKTYEKSIFAEHGINLSPWEEFLSCSKKGVLRGLHFQRNHSQAKLIHVLCGAVYDVAVDLRKGSDTFGKWESFLLTAENRQMLYIPQGFAHGFLVLEENTLVSYLCDNKYDPETDGGIRWNDPMLAVDWPLDCVERVILSDKDKMLPSLSEILGRYGPLCREADL